MDDMDGFEMPASGRNLIEIVTDRMDNLESSEAEGGNCTVGEAF